MKFIRYLIYLVSLGALLLAACTPAMLTGSGRPLDIEATNTPFQPNTPTSTATSTPTPVNTPSPSPTVTASPTSTPTLTPTITPTATWVFHPAGQIQVPILLYHHIADYSGKNRYYVSPETFRQQMESLYKWGYTTITPSRLRDVVVNGGELPDRPVILTFDDGDLDVYQNAFPIMNEFGFSGAAYIVANYLNATDYLQTSQLLEMMAAGWEIGSHGTSHIDLTKNHDYIRIELVNSHIKIEEAIGVPVKSFAYPFGMVDDFVLLKTQDYGYTTGMGLGTSDIQGLGNLFYLNRREVQSDFDLTRYASLLPWSTPLN